MFVSIWALNNVLGPVKVMDYDRDGKVEALFSRKVYEWQGNGWVFEDSFNIGSLGVYDSDGDGRLEMYFFYKSGYYPDTFYIFEADSLGRFEIDRSKAVYKEWGEISPNPMECKYYGDADRDGLRDIVCAPCMVGIGRGVCMYEAIGDNRWEKKVFENLGGFPVYTSPNMLDSDGDGKLEFAFESSFGDYYGIVEIVRNDSAEFAKVWFSGSGNGHLPLMLPDIDNDGKPEILFHSRRGYGTFMQDYVRIYEADGDNNWRLISNFSTMRVPGLSADRWFSTYGDIDLDGQYEIILNTLRAIVIIKSFGDNNFQVVDTLPINYDFKTVSNGLYDINGNGYKEIAVGVYYGGGRWRVTGYEYRPLSVGEGIVEDEGLIVGKDYIKVEGRGELRVYDALGRLVKAEKVDGKGKVSVKELPRGVYFVKFKGKVLKFIRR